MSPDSSRLFGPPDSSVTASDWPAAATNHPDTCFLDARASLERFAISSSLLLTLSSRFLLQGLLHFAGSLLLPIGSLQAYDVFYFLAYPVLFVESSSYRFSFGSSCFLFLDFSYLEQFARFLISSDRRIAFYLISSSTGLFANSFCSLG